LEGALTAHLGHEKHAPEGRVHGNSRNGKSTKRLKTGTGEMELEIPQDREGSFEPVRVPKGKRRFPGFDEKVIALCAWGIQRHLKEIYKVEVSPSLISPVTDAVPHAVKAWQARPLDPVCPIVYPDAIHVKMRTSGHVQT
jgi:putative transposase